MSRTPTGKVTKNRAKVLQKNGDIYIYEREYQYDPEIRKTKRILMLTFAKLPLDLRSNHIFHILQCL